MSLWRAQNGWVLVFAADPYCWRAFCMAFLNRTVLQEFDCASAWAEPVVNDLATVVLDTHRAEDIAGTCRTYGVPAAITPGWLDREAPDTSRALSEMLAYAALIEVAEAAS